jgi:hypothetical protein
MDVHAGAQRLVDPVQEPQELLMPVPRLALSDHGPFQYVQRSEQRCCPVALVIVCLPLGQSGTQGEDRLRSV